MVILQSAHGTENSTDTLLSEFLDDNRLLLTDLVQNSGAEPTLFATANRKNEPSC